MISLDINQEGIELSTERALNLEQREYKPGDLRGVFLAIAATDDPKTNCAVW